MKAFQILLIISAVIGCTNQPKHPFENVPCEVDEEIQYRVFKPCRQHIFLAKYWDSDFNLISEEKIWMMATGNPWEFDPALQREIIIQYEYDDEKQNRLSKYNLNPEVQSWTNMEVTGVIEDERSIWMHPFRSNQYNFTEVTPFPEVRMPLEVGSKWSGRLNIGDGWGTWANSTIEDYHEVIGFEKVSIPYGELDSWNISSYSMAEYGSSTQNLWFHEELGFVKIVIHNYAGQTLEIALLEVIES